MKKFFLITFVSIVFLSAMPPLIKEGTSFSETTLYVNPSTNDVSVGDIFVMNVSVADVIDLYAFGFYLGYNTTILGGLSVWVPPPFERPIEVQWAPDGYVIVTATSPTPFSGSGTLASITFNATAAGSSILDLYDTILSDSVGNPIPHTIIDGSVTVYSAIITVPDDYPTIQKAINAASDGDTIFVRPDTYYEHVVVNKSVSLIGENRSTTIVDGLAGWLAVFTVTANNVSISGFTVRNMRRGIVLCSSGNVVAGNIITNATGIAGQGILSARRASSNVISRNVVSNCWMGVWFSFSNSCTVNDNTITNNSFGIEVENIIVTVPEAPPPPPSTYYNFIAIARNTISNNGLGLSLQISSMNTIHHNKLSNNEVGLYLGHNSNINIIYQNNFIANREQVDLYQSYNNTWDNGYPLGGNYWSDYPGVDEFSGPYQNVTGSDGIGDTPYDIDENNQDNYPLMGMVSDFNATSEYQVQIICNSSISDFQFNGTAISFNVTGENSTTGFCRICIPKALMNENYTVLVNGTEVPHTRLQCSNSTHIYLYFTYSHSTQEVAIVPEFSAWASMLLLFIVLTVAIAIYKRRLLRTPTH